MSRNFNKLKAAFLPHVCNEFLCAMRVYDFKNTLNCPLRQ